MHTIATPLQQGSTSQVEATGELLQTLNMNVQPILDRKRDIAAFELTFRSDAMAAPICQDAVATAAALNHAFEELGAGGMLGKHTGNLNVSADYLMSDAVDQLPADRITLEIPRDTDFTPAVLQRCETLRKRGFRLALDGTLEADLSNTALLKVLDLVKVDISTTGKDQLRSVSELVKRNGLRSIATRVETKEQAQQCTDLGYDFVQGHFFAKPTPGADKKLSTPSVVLLRLLTLASSDADTDELIDGFKLQPDLTVQLLRIVNAASNKTANKISSINNALTMLGRRQLVCWLQVLAYATGTPMGTTFPSPLLTLAATRGKLLEYLAKAVQQGNKDFHDQAFLTGMLSLMDVHFSVPLPTLLEHVAVDNSITEALMERAGTLGSMLWLVESLEQPGFEDSQFGLQGLNDVEHGDLLRMQVQASTWAVNLAH